MLTSPRKALLRVEIFISSSGSSQPALNISDERRRMIVEELFDSTPVMEEDSQKLWEVDKALAELESTRGCCCFALPHSCTGHRTKEYKPHL